MNLHIDVTADALRVRGELDLSSAGWLHDSIANHPRATGALVLDLEGVTFIDSTGLAELIRPTRAGRAVVLRRPSRQVRTLLDLTAVSSLFDVVD